LKIWDRKSFEVEGHWPLWWGWKNEWPRRTDKSRTLKRKIQKIQQQNFIENPKHIVFSCTHLAK